MTGKQKCCPKCRKILTEDICPNCHEKTTERWSGFLGVTDFEKSDLAKFMGIKENGMYALKVRGR